MHCVNAYKQDGNACIFRRTGQGRRTMRALERFGVCAMGPITRDHHDVEICG